MRGRSLSVFPEPEPKHALGAGAVQNFPAQHTDLCIYHIVKRTYFVTVFKDALIDKAHWHYWGPSQATGPYDLEPLGGPDPPP